MFTRSSVHWAERIVATSSSSGVRKSNEHLASGYSRRRWRTTRSACRLASAMAAMTEPPRGTASTGASPQRRRVPDRSEPILVLSRTKCQEGRPAAEARRGPPRSAPPVKTAPFGWPLAVVGPIIQVGRGVTQIVSLAGRAAIMASFENLSFSFEDFGGKVRVFPLPNLVLFPHVMQPLHIFEPRYRRAPGGRLGRRPADRHGLAGPRLGKHLRRPAAAVSRGLPGPHHHLPSPGQRHL